MDPKYDLNIQEMEEIKSMTNRNFVNQPIFDNRMDLAIVQAYYEAILNILNRKGLLK